MLILTEDSLINFSVTPGIKWFMGVMYDTILHKVWYFEDWFFSMYLLQENCSGIKIPRRICGKGPTSFIPESEVMDTA